MILTVVFASVLDKMLELYRKIELLDGSNALAVSKP
jgi:hypothetical protein